MLTEQQAWQKIYDAFERYANGDFNRLAATGICSALVKLEVDGLIAPSTRYDMLIGLRFKLRLAGFDWTLLCWPITPEGAASRCEFIREHFLPEGTSESTEENAYSITPERVPAAADQP